MLFRNLVAGNLPARVDTNWLMRVQSGILQTESAAKEISTQIRFGVGPSMVGRAASAFERAAEVVFDRCPVTVET